MLDYKTISEGEADDLWACGVKDLEYKFTGVTINGQFVEWTPFNNWVFIGDKPSDVDWALGWRVKVE